MIQNFRAFAFAGTLMISAALTPAFANAISPTIPGSSSAEFQQALDHWLNDQDELAIPTLARLANKGNLAAQLFLGRIDGAYTSPHLQKLNAFERNELLRKNDVHFLKNWLAELSDDLPLAKYFAQTSDISTMAIGVKGLVMAGELSEAAKTYALLVNFGMSLADLLRAEENGLLPQQAHHLMLHAAFSIVDSKRTLNSQDHNADPIDNLVENYEAIFLQAYEKQPEDLKTDAELRDRAQRYKVLIRDVVADFKLYRQRLKNDDEPWLAAPSTAAQVKAVCKRACPSEVKACSRDAHLTIRYDHSYGLKNSPVEALITNTRFRNSKRAQNSVLRAAKTVMNSKDAAENTKGKVKNGCFYRFISNNFAQ